MTADMQTHKNPALKTSGGPPPIPKKPASLGGAEQSPSAPALKVAGGKPAEPQRQPVKELQDGKKWAVEYFKGDRNIIVTVENMKQSVYIYKCENSVVQVKGKLNSIALGMLAGTLTLSFRWMMLIIFLNFYPFRFLQKSFGSV